MPEDRSAKYTNYHDSTVTRFAERAPPFITIYLRHHVYARYQCLHQSWGFLDQTTIFVRPPFSWLEHRCHNLPGYV